MRTSSTRTMWPVLAALVFVSVAASADEPRRSIRVTGEGKATAKPDMATVVAGVVTEAVAASDALAANNTAMEKVLAVLKKSEIDSKDIQTTGLSVGPVYRQEREPMAKPQISHYRVSNEVSIKIRRLSEVGTVLDALVKAGSNQVSGITFGVAEPKPLLDQARHQAFQDARARAQLYANAAGGRLGKVWAIREQWSGSRQPLFVAEKGGGGGAEVPVVAGEEEFRVTLEAEFALEDPR